ncbi:MAG: PKD domain-containing protein [Polyangia bacterium]
MTRTVSAGRMALAGSIAALTLFAFGLGTGCGTKAGHPPIVRVTVTPGYVPLGDAYHTDVVLDGSGSRDQIDDPSGALPLGFAWTVEDDHATIAPSPSAQVVTVRIAGTHPVTAHLTVTDAQGDSASASAQIGVTAP